MIVLKKEIVTSLFILAGIEIKNIWELKNQYWPESYPEMILKYPWWLVETPFGFVQIGTRKRVIEIDWIATGIRKIITEDDVTKDYTIVHAWSIEKVLEYLKTLNQNANIIKDENSFPMNIKECLEEKIILKRFVHNNKEYKLVKDPTLKIVTLLTSRDDVDTGIAFSQQNDVYSNGLLIGTPKLSPDTTTYDFKYVISQKHPNAFVINTDIRTVDFEYQISYMIFVSKLLLDNADMSV